MKKTIALPLLCWAASIVSADASQGKLYVNQLEPKGRSALISSMEFNTSIGAKPGTSVGQTFTTTGAFDLRAITLVKGPSTSYKKDTKLRLTVFAWNPAQDANDVAQWKKGNGTGDGDALDGTGMAVLYRHEFDMPVGKVAEGHYIHLDLGTGIALAANSAYGFAAELVCGGRKPKSLTLKRHNGVGKNVYAAGAQLGTSATANKSSKNGDMVFFLGDTPPDRKATATILRREKIGDDVYKLTLAASYPSYIYPLVKKDTGRKELWVDAPHSIDGKAPFVSTNLAYSAVDDSGSNRVVYVRCTDKVPEIKLGDRYEGDIEARIHDQGNGTLPYRILIPDNYDPNRKYPLVVAFHGAGGTGTDNTSRSIEAWPRLSAPAIRKKYPAFVITPQSTTKWVETPWGKGCYSIEEVPISKPMTLVFEIVESLQKEFSIDDRRIYVIGQSMGGFGAWDCVMRRPEMFAALVPMAGAGDPSQAENLKSVAIWNFHGAEDTVVPTTASREMDAALKAAGHENYIYTEYPGVGHAVTKPAYAEPNLIPWIFSQKKAD